jgi:hypothetical protein
MLNTLGMQHPVGYSQLLSYHMGDCFRAIFPQSVSNSLT